MILFGDTPKRLRQPLSCRRPFHSETVWLHGYASRGNWQLCPASQHRRLNPALSSSPYERVPAGTTNNTTEEERRAYNTRV